MNGEIESKDWIDPDRVAALYRAPLHPRPAAAIGAAAPPLSHWLFFAPYADAQPLGEDGHPRPGGFLPDTGLARRMWAGSSIEFARPLRLGEPVRRRSRVQSIEHKLGRSGALAFVEVAHEISDGRGPVLRERQQIVYRDVFRPDRKLGSTRLSQPAEPVAWSRRVTADPILLFRYSALTFNSHRIHFDRDYARGAEGYAGLVVQGPLLATMLLDEWASRHPGRDATAFSFRALSPVFDGSPFELCIGMSGSAETHLFIRNADGIICMTASVTSL